MTTYRIIKQLTGSLTNLSAIIAKAEAHVASGAVTAEELLEARLFPDMLHFTRQVLIVTDNAKGIAQRLSGKDPVVFEDNEKTFEELKARIQKTIDYLATFQESDFADADTRKVTLHFMPGVYMYGADYLVEFGLPNLYFHLTTAYDILRHKGVPLGKADFIGKPSLHPIEA
jgi:uncharacterized protein